MTHALPLSEWISARRAQVDDLLTRRLPALPRDQDPGRLIEAMRYSLLSPGKRLRPLLALAAAQAVGGEADEPACIAAAAVELVHCYSLIHDDPPSMDDDDVRRGQPTSHKVFGEATAILAGDALLTLAFEWLTDAATIAQTQAQAGTPRRDFLAALAALARGAGMWGMVRGQARDLGEPAPTSVDALEQLHREKTGALFRAAVTVGAAVGGGTPAQIAAVDRFGDAYGIAFQHADDLHDEEHGHLAEHARLRLTSLTQQALGALATFDHQADALRELARALAARV